jgi:hypothetical protein
MKSANKFQIKRENVKIKVSLYNVCDFIMSHTCNICLGLLFLLISGFTNMAIVDIHLSAKEFTPFPPLFQYFPPEVLSILYKSKFVSTFPRDSFLICTMKYIKHYACNYIVSKYSCISAIPIQHFLQSYLPC